MVKVDSPAADNALSFFPRIYEEELLYSILARYSFIRDHSSRLMLNAELFGRQRGSVTVDLPDELDAIARRLPSKLGLDSETLAQRHTLFPYYAAALNPARKAALLDAMRAFGKRPSTIAGKRSGWIPKRTHLKFCSFCISEMKERSDELHWLRIHQLPVVLTCPTHRTHLQRGPAVGQDWLYLPATEENCAPDAPLHHVPESVAETTALLEIATLAREILEGSPSSEAPESANHFGKAFRRLGYCRAKGVDFVSLMPAAQIVLGELEKAFPAILDRSRAKPVWLDHLVDGRSAQQADTVLVGTYLLRHLPQGPVHDELFGPAPWECFNPLASHKGKRVVRRYDTLRHLQDGSWRARFYCRCGYSYVRTRLPDGTLRRSKTLRIGPLLVAFIQNSASQGQSLYAAAKQIGIAPVTLYSLGLREGISMPWKAPAGVRAL